MALKKPTLAKDWMEHYGQAYGPLVEALQAAVEVADCYPEQEKYSTRWRDLLRKLGEEVPQTMDEALEQRIERDGKPTH